MSNKTVKSIIRNYFIFELAALIYFIVVFIASGRLPIPFFDDAGDTFMDFFHVLRWSDDPGRYTIWHSIYPPLTFLFANLLNEVGCAYKDAFDLRQCSLLSYFPLVCFYIISVVILGWKLQNNCSESNKVGVLLLSGFMILSGPSLFALERGNFVLMAFSFLVLSCVSKKKYISSFFLALAILMKPYLILIAFAKLLVFDIGYLIGLGVSMLIIWVCSVYLLGDPNWVLFYDNIKSFTGANSRTPYEILINATSFIAWVKFFSSKYVNLIDGSLKDITILVFRGVYIIVIFYSALTVKNIVKHRGSISFELAATLVMVAGYCLLDGLGYYSIILIYPFVLNLICKSNSRLTGYNLAFIVLILILISPIEYGVGPHRPVVGNNIAFLSGKPYETGGQVGLISLARPLMFLLLLIVCNKIMIKNGQKNDHSVGVHS